MRNVACLNKKIFLPPLPIKIFVYFCPLLSVFFAEKPLAYYAFEDQNSTYYIIETKLFT